MLKLLIGFLVGVFAGYVLGLVVPVEFFFIACLVLLVLAVLWFYLFHLGLRDFQEYLSCRSWIWNACELV
jgi:uncharacterized membrane protein YfcA